MNNEANLNESVPSNDKHYEPPELTSIGEARNVVLGLPGSGFDGPYGMTDPTFEFEPDGE